VLAHQVSAKITVRAYWQQPRHWPWWSRAPPVERWAL